MRNSTNVWRNSGLIHMFGLTMMFLLATVTAHAQQTTGVPCSPSATTTIGGKSLPPAPQEFGGVINLSAKDSRPCWPPQWYRRKVRQTFC
jgi:hypothetical protein